VGNVLNDIDHQNRVRDSKEVMTGLRRAWISHGRPAKPPTEHEIIYDSMREQCYLEMSMNPREDFQNARETWFGATSPDDMFELIMQV
jgi:hypothetical protein